MMEYVRFGLDTMEGLDGVMVLAELNAPGLGKPPAPSLDPKKLKSMLERTLFQAGVGILSSDGLKGAQNHPVLFLRASVLAVGGAAYCYGLNLFLMQSVALSAEKATSAITWEHGMVGSVVNNEWHTLENSVSSLAAKFSQDFLKANPPKDAPEVGSVN